MTQSLIHEQTVHGPATHALIVGVGRYPYLFGGQPPQGSAGLFPSHGGMGQLSSPPLSATAFAKWLIERFDHPDKPLASVCLLTAGDEREFEHPTTGQRTALVAPTFGNLESAARWWKNAGDQDPNSLLVFYFCGHGIENGPDLALLLEDFGAVHDAALESALDFRKFHLGMEQCKAREQVYFIDACRVGCRTLVDGYAGRAIFTPTPRRDPTLPGRQKPVFYSTFAGSTAQSQVGEVSFFTSALLHAFEGGGADDTDGDWWVDTNQLQKTIQFRLERRHANGAPKLQINPVDDMSTFALHRLPGDPTVPVLVGCRPEALNDSTVLSWTAGNGTEQRKPPKQGDWELELDFGDYAFSAERGGDVQQYVPNPTRVRPPYRRILFKEAQ